MKVSSIPIIMACCAPSETCIYNIIVCTTLKENSYAFESIVHLLKLLIEVDLIISFVRVPKPDV